MGYGDTPSRVLNNLATMAERPITCVSLTGGVSYYLPDTRSNVFNAKLHLIPTPLLASSKEMADAMSASQAYSANVTAFNVLKQVTAKGLEIGR